MVDNGAKRACGDAERRGNRKAASQTQRPAGASCTGVDAGHRQRSGCTVAPLATAQCDGKRHWLLWPVIPMSRDPKSYVWALGL